MYQITCVLLTLLATPGILGDISVTDYVYWTREDIMAWHQYFPSRFLEQERLTNLLATATAPLLEKTLAPSLAATVRYQAQELDTAQLIMEGTSAQGCVKGIATYMDKAVEDELSTFRDCNADVVPRLQRLYKTWAKTNVTYHTALQRALVGIDSCARTYRNRDSWDRLRTCIDSWTNNYFTAANTTTSGFFYSPSMGVFTNYMTGCAETAVLGVVEKGWKFLDMLVQCARLSENVNAEAYEKQLTSEFNKYVTSNNLHGQIWDSQYNNYKLVGQIQQEMISYYDLQKRALERYVIESRDQSYYYAQLEGYLQNYFSTISSTSLDNPANMDCIIDATSALNDIVATGSLKALECDEKIVNDTKLRIARVNEHFLEMNSLLPYVGDVAIISCMKEGYIFAENTLSNCYSLTFNEFNFNVTQLNAVIVDDVDVLLGYEKSFFSNSSLPCGDSILVKATLEAERALYNLQRCLYINTGTKYAVTTYAPSTPGDSGISSAIYSTSASPSLTTE